MGVVLVIGCVACSVDEPVGRRWALLFFDVPNGVIGMEGDALVSELDNPVITGRVNLEGIDNHADTGLSWPYDTRLDYGPEARILRANVPVFDPGLRLPDEPGPDPGAGPELTRVWLDFEGDDGPFVSPSVSLPPRLAADASEHVYLHLGERGGPEPWETDLAEPLLITLHPQVIVVPVHVHAFVHDGEVLPPFGTGSNSPVDIDVVRNWLDPSPVVERQATLVKPDETFEAYTLMDRLVDMAMAPDGIWAQCGVQFRLASFEIIDATASELAFSLADDDECLAAEGICELDRFRFGPYVHDALRAEPAGLHVFLGGEISGLCTTGATDVFGLTCSDACGFGMGYRPPYFTLIAMSDTFMLAPESRIRVLAHELGHLLTLGHEDIGSCTSGGFDGANLMYSAAHVDGIELTTEQCEVARSAALTYLDAWGLPAGSEWTVNYAP